MKKQVMLNKICKGEIARMYEKTVKIVDETKRVSFTYDNVTSRQGHSAINF